MTSEPSGYREVVRLPRGTRYFRDAVCPVCGHRFKLVALAKDIAELDANAAVRDGALLVTCQQHTLADMHAKVCGKEANGMSAQLADVRPCLPSCGGSMRLKATFKGPERFGLYRCQTCRREAIEAPTVTISDSVGVNSVSKYRPGQEIPE